MVKEKYVALTFDDGPCMVTTSQVLDVLEKEQVPGSFFLIGENIQADTRAVLKRELALGCELCNHSFSHPGLPSLTEDEIREQLQKTSDLIVEASGKCPAFFRPPYIAVDQRVMDIVAQMGMTSICGLGCDDWDENVGVEQRVDTIVHGAADGLVLLMHDLRENPKTVEAIQKIIPSLKAQGYTFVTISDLFEKCGVKPKEKVLYSNAFQTTRYPWGDALSDDQR